ncbi:MAG: ribonuclease P protein component 4 [archaeon]
MKRRRHAKPGWQKQIALERIAILFEQAEIRFKSEPELSKRYVELARRISMRYLAPMPKQCKERFCKTCGAYLKPGVNCRVRLNPKNRVRTVSCLGCGAIRRVPY